MDKPNDIELVISQNILNSIDSLRFKDKIDNILEGRDSVIKNAVLKIGFFSNNNNFIDTDFLLFRSGSKNLVPNYPVTMNNWWLIGLKNGYRVEVNSDNNLQEKSESHYVLSSAESKILRLASEFHFKPKNVVLAMGMSEEQRLRDLLRRELTRKYSEPANPDSIVIDIVDQKYKEEIIQPKVNTKKYIVKSSIALQQLFLPGFFERYSIT